MPNPKQPKKKIDIKSDYIKGFRDGVFVEARESNIRHLKIIGILRQIGTIKNYKEMEKVLNIIRKV